MLAEVLCRAFKLWQHLICQNMVSGLALQCRGSTLKLKAYKVCVGQPLRYLRPLVVFAGGEAVFNVHIKAPSC